MQCWKCGGQTVGGVCTLCGGRESDRKPAVTPAGKALRYVYDKFGAKRTLTENGVLVRCLGDVLPEDAELRQALMAALAAGAGREFYAVLESNQPLTDATFQGLERVLQAAGLEEKETHAALVTLRDMAGCGVPASSQPQPAPQPVPNRPMERPKVQSAPVERPKYSQEQPRQAPAPKPVQTHVDMGWHDVLCKRLWWIAAVTGLLFLFYFSQYPYGQDILPEGLLEIRLCLTVVFLSWGFIVRKRLSSLVSKAYNHIMLYLAAVFAVDFSLVSELTTNSYFFCFVEYYQSKATGYEEFTGLAWAYWIYGAVCVVLLALTAYTCWYYKNPQRRALFDQK